MGKSDLKSVLCEFCPHVFQAANEEDVVFPVVIDDAITKLRSWGHSVCSRYPQATQIHIDTLIHDIFHEAVLMLKECRCYVALFDKPSLVTMAKEPEQDKRDLKVAPGNSTATKQVPASFTHRATRPIQCYQSLDNFNNIAFHPSMWRNLVNTRESRAMLIRCMCWRAAAILPLKFAEVGVPPGHHMVIDFEGLKEETAVLPLVLFTKAAKGSSTETNDQQDCSFPSLQSIYRNQLGEFDVACLHYLHSPQIIHVVEEVAATVREQTPGQTAAVLLKSIDTDMLPITTLNAGHTAPVRVECSLTNPKRQALFNPSALHQWIRDALPGATPVEDFTRMFVLAGSDFVEGCPGMSAYTAMKQYLYTCTETGTSDPESIIQRSLFSGSVNASANLGRVTARQKKKDAYDIHNSSKRAHWCVNYWKHSAFQTEHLLPSCLGHGFSVKKNEPGHTKCVSVVYTESIDLERQHGHKRAKHY